MVDIHDYDIQCIEHEILWKYDKSPCDYPDCDCLLSLRKDMINERILAHQEEILPDIIAFNDALTAALRELYDRTHRIWNSIKDNADFKDAEIEAKCYLGYDYPKLHPVQGDDRQDLWNAICDAGWNKLYDDGVSLTSLFIPRDNESFESFIGMDDEYNNWNEGLDRDLTKDLHLTSDTTNKLVNIDINDVRDLFQEGEKLHTFDVSVPDNKGNRMQLLMEQIKKCSKCHEPYNRALVFFFFPEERPLLMEEMKPLSEWIESVPGEFMIKWGMAIHHTPMFRAIVVIK